MGIDSEGDGGDELTGPVPVSLRPAPSPFISVKGNSGDFAVQIFTCDSNERILKLTDERKVKTGRSLSCRCEAEVE